MKNNPDYKGKWSAPMIENPNYKVLCVYLAYHYTYIMHEYNYLHLLTTMNVNGAGLFAGEIKPNTCCVAMVKPPRREL